MFHFAFLSQKTAQATYERRRKCAGGLENGLSLWNDGGEGGANDSRL